MSKPFVLPDAIKNVLEFRHACKQFDVAKKIPSDQFQLILEAARLAPSSYGFEPWNIIVLQDENLRKKVVKTWSVSNAPRAHASHVLLFTAKTASALDTKASHIQHILKDVKGLNMVEAAAYAKYFRHWAKKDFGLYDSPHLLHAWAARQAYIALGMVMETAAMLGIDSCAIEGYNVQKLTQVLTAENLIDPKKDLPVVMLALGYRTDEQPPRKRRPLSEIVKTV